MLTRERLADDLRRLGVRPGTALIVHASLRATGPVAGSEPTEKVMLGALRDAVAERGTVVAPVFTTNNSDTSRAYFESTAGMTDRQAARYRAALPAFDARNSPSQGMGRLAEAVRRAPGAVRSGHPQSSFAAVGADAESLMSGHALTSHLGERSPLARLYDLPGAMILLLNVGYDVCTAFHLAESRIPHPPRREYRCVVRDEGVPRWVSFQDVDLDDGDFALLGNAYEGKAKNDLPGHWVSAGQVGSAGAKLIPVRAAVDFAAGWLAEKRCPGPAYLMIG